MLCWYFLFYVTIVFFFLLWKVNYVANLFLPLYLLYFKNILRDVWGMSANLEFRQLCDRICAGKSVVRPSWFRVAYVQWCNSLQRRGYIWRASRLVMSDIRIKGLFMQSMTSNANVAIPAFRATFRWTVRTNRCSYRTRSFGLWQLQCVLPCTISWKCMVATGQESG